MKNDPAAAYYGTINLLKVSYSNVPKNAHHAKMSGSFQPLASLYNTVGLELHISERGSENSNSNNEERKYFLPYF